MNDPYLLKLYVCGHTSRADRAVADLQHLCEHELAGRYRVEVIDVLKQPQLAEHEKILATPTVVKELPPPIRRVIGDLSDTQSVLLGLDLHSASANQAGNQSTDA